MDKNAGLIFIGIVIGLLMGVLIDWLHERQIKSIVAENRKRIENFKNGVIH